MGCVAHTASPSIRVDPRTRLSGSQADHQLANTVVTIRPHKGPILSAFNMKTPTKHALWLDQRTEGWDRIQAAMGVGAEIMPMSQDMD